MKRSAKTDYACLALIRLARRPSGCEWASQKEICQGQDFPQGFLIQIMQRLRQSGLVEAARGACGGYRLARPAEAISVADVLRAVEGQSAATPRIKVAEGERILSSVWRQASRAAEVVLESTTIAELAESAYEPISATYDI